MTLSLLLSPSTMNAHPIHSTLAVVAVDSTGVTIRLRAFADDFSAAVARFAGKRPPADSSAPAADVARYAAARLDVTTAAGTRVPLKLCGVERARDLYWVCVRAEPVGGSRGMRLRNLVLTELHADQVNVVQVKGAAASRTLLFTKESPASSLER